MADPEFIKSNEKIADAVVHGYKKIEEGVVGAYKKVEVGFVDRFLTHEGETVEDAKKRLRDKQAKREAEAKKAAEKHAAEAQSVIRPGSDVGKAGPEISQKAARAGVEASRNAGKQ